MIEFFRGAAIILQVFAAAPIMCLDQRPQRLNGLHMAAGLKSYWLVLRIQEQERRMMHQPYA